MKVLMLIGTLDPGGAETVVVSLSKALIGMGHEVVVGHLGNAWLQEQLNRHNVKQEVFGFSPYYKSNLTGPLFICHLERFVRKYRFDIVHAHLFGMILFGTFAVRLARIPIVGTIHDTHYIQGRSIRALAYWLVSSLGCRLITVSRDMQSIVCRLTGLNQEKVTVIYNGVNIKGFHERESGNGRVAVASVGRLSPEKNFSTLLYAAKQAAEGIPECRFLIAGDGPQRDELWHLAKELGLGERVIFLGHTENVSQLLAESRVFVLSSLTEGLSMSVIEAMAAGAPVVVTDVGGNREIVVDGETGFLVPPRDPEALANKVCLLLRDKALAKQMGENGRKRVESLFSQERMVRDYEQLYLSLLEKKGRRCVNPS
ncbi:MAG: glycosyltransferase [Candidatus Abyssubacteria bacterium]